jgi:hypothetical protein
MIYLSANYLGKGVIVKGGGVPSPLPPLYTAEQKLDIYWRRNRLLFCSDISFIFHWLQSVRTTSNRKEIDNICFFGCKAG